jgi:hypothetical protein
MFVQISLINMSIYIVVNGLMVRSDCSINNVLAKKDVIAWLRWEFFADVINISMQLNISLFLNQKLLSRIS